MKRNHPHADEFVRRPLVSESLEGEGQLGQLRFDAPSAPGSSTSADAAALVSVDGECLRCLTWFAQQSGPRTRYQLAHAVYPITAGRDTVGVGNACGRANALVTLGYLESAGREKKR